MTDRPTSQPPSEEAAIDQPSVDRACSIATSR